MEELDKIKELVEKIEQKSKIEVIPNPIATTITNNVYKNKSVWDYVKVRWLDHYLEGHKGFVAGGCFKNIFLGEKVKDIDIFFYNSEDQIAARMFFETNEDYVKYYDNDKVDALKNKYTGIVVELVKTVFGNPQTIISNFDFTITKFSYHKQNFYVEIDGNDAVEERWMVTFHENFFDHLTQKRLVIDNDFLTKPASTFDRMFKYGKYGFFPCRASKEKMIRFLQGIDTNTLSKSMYDGID